MKVTILFATLAALLAPAAVSAQNSCTAVAYLGQTAPGGTCTGQELGDASQTGAGFGACSDEVTNASCVMTENHTGDCVIHLYSDGHCQTPIGGGNTVTCGDPADNVNFDSFQIECA